MLEAVVGWKGTWEDQNLWYGVEQQSLSSAEILWKTRKAAVRTESAEAQDDVFCQDVEFDSSKSLEELGMIPSSWRASPGQAHVRRVVQRDRL